MIKLASLISSKRQEQTGRLTERPFQMDIADLGVLPCLALACRFMSTLDQPCVGNKVAHLGEAVDVVDLVEYYQGQGFPHTWNSAEQMNGYRIVFGGRTWALI